MNVLLLGKPLQRRDNVEGWKKSAVFDTSMASVVIALLRQEAYLDAYRQLRKWERNYPTSKASSDYVIQEATFFMTVGNRQRARTLLEAYCDNVDASSYVADAAELLLRCMMYDREPDDVLTKFCDKMKKRFQFHPFADRVNGMLQQLRSSEVKMEGPTQGI